VMDSIIYISPSRSSFVRKDIDFLSKRYRVLSPDHNWKNKGALVFTFLKQAFFLLSYIRTSKAIVVMFGGYWAFLPALLGRVFNTPVFIILGGTDCVSFPALNYGNLRKPLLRTVIGWSYSLSSKLIPVDDSLVKQHYSYSHRYPYPEQGFMSFFPNLKTPHHVIYNGFDSNQFISPKEPKELNSFICVASVDSIMRYTLKGIDLIVELANTFKQCKFKVIGVSDELNKRVNPNLENLEFISFIDQTALVSYLQDSEFYLQLSISEGFPNALCEAMLCGCIPIGSGVGAIPKIIGETGFVISSDKIMELCDTFQRILSLSSEERLEKGAGARQRIITEFDIKKRESEFFQLVEHG
jgi:glycosyltransferase involved in cell wall biosynthesis